MNINNFSQNDLILFCINKIEQLKEDCTFERLVYECFATFPERFSFYTYRLPDSIKLDRQLRTLRKTGFITGNNKYGFKLTNNGHKIATELQKLVTISLKSTTSPTKKDILSLKSRGGRKEQIMIGKIISSPLYKKFENNPDISLTVDEIRILFFGTLETPLQSLLENIGYIENIAKKSKHEDLLKFISACKRSIKNKLKGVNK